MPSVTYQIVEREDGWAYRVGDVCSEIFPSHADALEAARGAARDQRGAEGAVRREEPRSFAREAASADDLPETQGEARAAAYSSIPGIPDGL